MSRPRWTKAQTVKVVKEILGPLARVWERDGRVSIGYSKGDKHLVLGSGVDYREAVHNVFLVPFRNRERLAEVMREELAAKQTQPSAELPVEDPAQETTPVIRV